MSESPLKGQPICQVAIVVRDVEKTAKKFAEVFQTPAPAAVLTDTVDKSHAQYRGHPTQARAKLAFFQMGQVAIELIEPVGRPSTWGEFLDAHGEGVHHIAFRVEDGAKTVSYLAGLGIPLVQKGDFTGGSYKYFDSAAVLGVILETLEKR